MLWSPEAVFTKVQSYLFLFLGIVLADPEIPLDATLIPSPSPRPKNPVFEDEKKSKVRETILGYCVNAASH